MDDFLYSHTLYSGYSSEFLRTLFRNSKGLGFRIFDNKNNNFGNPSFLHEIFLNYFAQKHPFLNIMVGWAGNNFYAKEMEKITESNDFTSDKNIKIKDNKIEIKEQKKGYLYIDFSYSIEKIDNELDKSFDGNQYTDRNKFWTPVVCPMIDIDETITHIKREKYVFHPFIRIGKTERGHYFSEDYFNKRYFYKVYNDEKKGACISIPIYVYRLVAETYLDNPNPRKYSQVHHILNNGYNNSVFNLMWVTDEQHRWIEER